LERSDILSRLKPVGFRLATAVRAILPITNFPQRAQKDGISDDTKMRLYVEDTLSREDDCGEFSWILVSIVSFWKWAHVTVSPNQAKKRGQKIVSLME
jgi:hypothetical protein